MAREPVTQETEALPEADRFGEFPHPRMTARLYGHAATEAMLADAVASGRMHHGWLISGPEGIGKATLAYSLARTLLARPEDRRRTDQVPLAVDPASSAFRQVAALSHPAMLILRRPWDSKGKRHTAGIPVDEVRRLRSFLGHTGEAGSNRVVLVDTADDLGTAAANALLKSLEEPPPATIFILITSEPGGLLPTIRSRVRKLDLAPLGPDDLKAAAQQAIGATADARVPAPGDWPKLVDLAQGSVRRALAVSSSGGLKLYDDARRMLELLPKVDWAAVHKLGDDLGGAAAEQSFDAFFQFLTDLVARLIRVRAGGGGTADDQKLAGRLIGDGKLAEFAEFWTWLVRTKAETKLLNLDKKGLILATADRLASLSAPAR